MLVSNIMLDESGHIREWNTRAESMFGYSGDAIVGRHYATLYGNDVPPEQADALLRAARDAGYADHEGYCVRNDGAAFPAQTLLTAVKAGRGATAFSLVIHNLSERSQAEQQRREDSARLNGIIQSAMDAIVTVDDEQKIVLFNAAAERIFCCSAADAIGSSLDRFVPQRFRAAHRQHVQRFGNTGVTMRRMGAQTVLVGLRADGAEFPIDASISQVTVEGRKLFTVILRDITERQKAAADLERSHRELRDLYASMHEVREAERTRIARELHDELAQWLTALKMDVSWVAARLPRDLRSLADKAERMKGVVDTTVAAVRRIAADLRPVMIDDLGLVPAIEHLLHEFSQRSGLVVSLDARVDGVEFREPLATALYRMTQEALTNVARHAAARHAEVTIVSGVDNLVVRVRDDGKGLDPAAPKKEKSFGLLGIQERAQTLGGSARFYSPPEGGTVVEIDIPLRANVGREAAA